MLQSYYKCITFAAGKKKKPPSTFVKGGAYLFILACYRVSSEGCSSSCCNLLFCWYYFLDFFSRLRIVMKC